MPGYIVALIISGFVWTYFFVTTPKCRKEMLIVGFLVAPLVILDYFTTPVYWTPTTLGNIPVGVEAFVFTFFIAGIAAVVYENIFHFEIKGDKKLNLKDVLHIIPPALISFGLWLIFQFNFMNLITLVLFTTAVTHLIFRRDLLKESLISALFFALIYFLGFQVWALLSPEILGWWNFNNLSGLSVGFIPLEEILFSLAFGALVGPLYEVITDAKIIHSKPLKKSK